jgi:uncharacterized membrane protein
MSNDTVRTVTVAGANLFKLSAQYLGQAEQWNRIASLNGVFDFLLTGVTVLKIPPVDKNAGNGGVLGI